MNQTSAGLVLVSPDYLVSSWCRRELQLLHDAFVEKKLVAVYWLLLRPCGWKHCEQLSRFQAVQEPVEKALMDPGTNSVCELFLLSCCDNIARHLVSIVESELPELEELRSILRQASPDVRLMPSAKVTSGDFSLSSRALWPSGDDVYVKVLTNAPLTRMRDLFFKVSMARKEAELRNASLIRIHKVEQVGTKHEQRIVILTDMARSLKEGEGPDSLGKVIEDDRKLEAKDRHLTQDVVKSILVKIAEALAELHETRMDLDGNASNSYTHIMGPLVPAYVFYNRSTQRPLLSLTSVSNFLWQFFEPESFGRLINPDMGGYTLPERKDPVSGKPVPQQTFCGTYSPRITQKADQYFLGMLALELLEGKVLFSGHGGGGFPNPLSYFDNEANHAWCKRNDALAQVIEKLLREDPGARYENMREVAAALIGVEDQKRALAKHSYREYIAPKDSDDPDNSAGVRFSEKFYKRFFEKSADVEAAFKRAQEQNLKKMLASTTGGSALARNVTVPSMLPLLEHHKKLIAALAAVLNYRGGSRPTSISPVVERHREIEIADSLFDYFKESFLEVLREEIQMKRPEGGDAEARETCAAWEELFAPVMKDMKRRPGGPAA